MKKCARCGQEYDNTMSFCLDDGAELLYGPALASSGDEPATAILSEAGAAGTGFRPDDAGTRQHRIADDDTAILLTRAEPRESLGGLVGKQSFSANSLANPLIALVVAAVVLIGGYFGYRYFSPPRQIQSIAVMPFVNESGNPDSVAPTLVSTFLKYLQSGSAKTLFKFKGFTPLALAQVGVPVEKEPMHRLKFENEFVRLFDVLIPVGKTSQYHTHLYDGVSVRVSNAQIIDEVVGGEKATIEIKFAEATFGARPSPLTHRVVNSGKSDFRNIFVEILPSKNAAAATTFPILSDGHVIIIDNARVRVNRLVLKPGESSKLHTHQMRGLGIILYDSRIELSAPGGTRRTLESRAGDFVWQNAGTTHVIKNIGSMVFEAIEIELKEGRSDPMTLFASNYATAWSSNDPESVAKFFSEHGSLKVNDGKPAVGRGAITEIARGFMTAFPDMVVRFDKIIEKAGITEFHWTLTGTNTGPGGKGNYVKISGYEEWRIGSDGLIADSKGHFDEAEYNRQIERNE